MIKYVNIHILYLQVSEQAPASPENSKNISISKSRLFLLFGAHDNVPTILSPFLMVIASVV